MFTNNCGAAFDVPEKYAEELEMELQKEKDSNRFISYDAKRATQLPDLKERELPSFDRGGGMFSRDGRRGGGYRNDSGGRGNYNSHNNNNWGNNNGINSFGSGGGYPNSSTAPKRGFGFDTGKSFGNPSGGNGGFTNSKFNGSAHSHQHSHSYGGTEEFFVGGLSNEDEVKNFLAENRISFTKVHFLTGKF